MSKNLIREYDLVLSGDVKIKKVSSDTHKITFSKKNISKVLMYQVWSNSSVELNNDRVVKEVKATTWVKNTFPNFFNDNDTTTPNSGCLCTADYNPVTCGNGITYSNSCNANCAGQTNCLPSDVVSLTVPFTPIAVMELDDGDCPFHHKCNKHHECRHVFVINRALVNKCDQVVFYVSSKDIVLPSIVNKELKLLNTIPTGSFRRVRFDLS
jgi:hypothetical protein